ncbi:MAG: acyl-CoA dehydrogenase family protein, partial [Acidimicrobiia bacterium]|nr:acyl-CoA dehydrogenase family protein [Acidimicrobiia bacterium]
PEAEDFRAEFRAWLDENLDDDLVGTRPMAASESPEALERMRAWNRKLADARYAAIAWPAEYGGRGAGVMEQVVYAEELHRSGAPGTLNVIGISNIAPSIMEHGTEEQKRRFLPAMLRGDDVWCQGFSEPNAGSDLASLQTRAVADGDDYVVNGQKVWNTLGVIADWCELLVRTDPDVPKHKGISCLLVDMRLPGVEVRPLVTITGEAEFSEIFFTDVRVPESALLGPENDGWRVAMTTLTHERGGVASLHLGVRKKIAGLLDLARSTTRNGRPAADDPVLRQSLARLYLEGEYLKLLSDRAVSGLLHGRPAGPETSLAKLVWSECETHIADVAGQLLGAAANTGSWGRDRVYARALSIAGGTTQVNKNIVAQRVLGLPRG